MADRDSDQVCDAREVVNAVELQATFDCKLVVGAADSQSVGEPRGVNSSDEPESLLPPPSSSAAPKSPLSRSGAKAD
ncbi:MAG: hypothetical protein HUU22_12000 [Phycisphaerae bacterium]|nr:hypothetical protein [Phycisphaerae bacterium]NUQ46742.1 hypothetical protein [Phycisphaerae bacterium]